MGELPSVIRLHPRDNVVVARRNLAPGDLVPEEKITCMEKVEAGHKLAVSLIAKGDPVIKYDQIIGLASRLIPPGAHVHTHNLVVGDYHKDYAPGSCLKEHEFVSPQKRVTFQGILRKSGKVGTRNYIAILSSVNCSATVARAIAERFKTEYHPGVDGVVALVHAEGCGMGGRGESFEAFQRVFKGLVAHPNLAGVLLVGLGCEVNQVGDLLGEVQQEQDKPLEGLVIQERGGTRKSVEAGVEMVREMLRQAGQVARVSVSADHLILGVECGGSDGYSGISANPALGVAADLLVAHGGTVVLGETPEIYGAEHLLTRRAVDERVARKLLEKISWWEDYVRSNHGEMDNNPSPGNKAGGLSTILEKSLGAVSKGGTTNLVEVYDYAQPVSAKGLVFMDTPGYDPASVTGMVAGGVNLVAFTTGRGSAFGCKPVPVLKLATNSRLYVSMEEDMDIDCGTILEGLESLEEAGQRIFRAILDVASGKRTKSELLGYGDLEFVPWRMGALM
ncbi:MAG: altronate dehydratase family protein [bacterium]